ncbi:NO-binding membrane sensor protein with MHYT domain [Mesorhizobium soli]|jgi:NO-binding membrane sensor protein with MHYT domain|uniref:MHYT domain-containing protein n=1 Tax=Pseudaminobacter soli (ex Li et al. 2025) TaxID=1295366 RepID=UPI002474E664|nr:MHYT domain-containing protein [Mesorhizobium soli]MDH6235135.1 NO-binding membrane sensor protein with MHYT domain [Mesorhizobium soli]
MLEGHNPYLVALSILVAILGGYTGFGLAARIRGTPGFRRRLLLAGATCFLALGIWTMHFVGLLATQTPPGTNYLVLPTVVSFLICALVVGVSLFFISMGEPSEMRVAAAALLLGAGIVSMHYVGIRGLNGPFRIEHDRVMVLLSVLIAVATAYGGLHIFMAHHVGRRLALSAIAFGIAVSGMHYTAMHGMHFIPAAEAAHPLSGVEVSPQDLSLVVAPLCFLIAAGFLLFLVPEPRAPLEPGLPDETPSSPDTIVEGPAFERSGRETSGPHLAASPLGGLGQPRIPSVSRLPVEGVGGTHFIDIGDIRSVRADAHYTQIHDGVRERMCLWSISDVEARLDPDLFLRVHRSHIIAIPHVVFMRREGDGAMVELDGPHPHIVPVSRAKIAELRTRLGLARRNTQSDR